MSDATQRLIFGVKLEAWRRKMFHIFNFLQSDIWFWELLIPYSEFLMPSPVKKIA